MKDNSETEALLAGTKTGIEVIWKCAGYHAYTGSRSFEKIEWNEVSPTLILRDKLGKTPTQDNA